MRSLRASSFAAALLLVAVAGLCVCDRASASSASFDYPPSSDHNRNDDTDDSVQGSDDVLCIKMLQHRDDLFCKLGVDHAQNFDGNGRQVTDVEQFCEFGCFSDAGCSAHRRACPSVEDLVGDDGRGYGHGLGANTPRTPLLFVLAIGGAGALMALVAM